MGACATKPKVLKDDAEAPAPAPEQEAPAGSVEEENKVVEKKLDVEATGADKREEESLSSLPKENEAEPAAEPVKQETEIPIDLTPVEPKPELSAAAVPPPVAIEAEAKSDEAAEKKPEESK